MKHMQPYHLIYEDKYFLEYLRKGIIVDSGVLLEFLKWHYLKTKKRKILNEDQKEMFKQLERFLSINCKKYITQHILAELSNLINKESKGSEEFSNFIDLIKTKLEDYYEIQIGKGEILKEKVVNKFGVTDTGIILLSKKDNKIILTYDEPFCDECKFAQDLPALHLEDLNKLFLTLSCLPK